MAFRFALESILRLRASLERQEQTRLEMAARQVYSARERCESLEKERIDLEEKFLISMKAGIESSDLHFHLSARSGLEFAQLEAERALVEAQKRWNEQRTKFLQARRDREVMASIRERQHAEYVTEQARREQQQIDDLFAMRRIRPNG